MMKIVLLLGTAVLVLEMLIPSPAFADSNFVVPIFTEQQIQEETFRMLDESNPAESLEILKYLSNPRAWNRLFKRSSSRENFEKELRTRFSHLNQSTESGQAQATLIRKIFTSLREFDSQSAQFVKAPVVRRGQSRSS